MPVGNRYNSVDRYNSDSRYNQNKAAHHGGDALTLNTIVEGAVGPDQPPVTLGECLRIMLAVLAGHDTGANINSREATFYAPDGVTERLSATLDGRGNRERTTLKPNARQG